MASAGQTVWQVLPLGPCGLFGSPYDSSSAFAGNRYLVSPEQLLIDGWISNADLESPPGEDDFRDEETTRRWRDELLRVAWERCARDGPPARRAEVQAWSEELGRARWLSDWALFAALKRKQGEASWRSWPGGVAQRTPAALAEARSALAEEIALEEFVQYLFFAQWNRVRGAARALGISILGDVPIYAAFESSDVWAGRGFFELDDAGDPIRVAGVPPDYFSETGQRWGNPLYRWDRLAADGFSWWIDRMRHAFSLFDFVRIDHFRGFEAYWAVPASEPTAAAGSWEPGPGRRLFDAVDEALGPLPIIAEDLGIITPEVTRLRKELGLPGMKVLQFGFSESGGTHDPRRIESDNVVYTGTHDNDTTRGWFEAAAPEERDRALALLGGREEEIVRAMIRAALDSSASLSVIPMQDILELGPEARFNRPGQVAGNWRWRLKPDDLDPSRAAWLKGLVRASGRLP